MDLAIGRACWAAAQSGDTLARATLADHFEETGRQDLANLARTNGGLAPATAIAIIPGARLIY
jgi:hypothetical protein